MEAVAMRVVDRIPALYKTLTPSLVLVGTGPTRLVKGFYLNKGPACVIFQDGTTEHVDENTIRLASTDSKYVCAQCRKPYVHPERHNLCSMECVAAFEAGEPPYGGGLETNDKS